MPIPDFDHNGVLPPHLGNPVTKPDELSPYTATTLELCQKFGFSAERRMILQGFLELRNALRQIGVTQAFHWLDGSFLEDCEGVRNRPPDDLDVVTFFVPPGPALLMNSPLLPILQNRGSTKARFHTDHILVSLTVPPGHLVYETRYWFSIFTHRRLDEVWKGMLGVGFDTPNDDAQALAHLNSLTGP